MGTSRKREYGFMLALSEKEKKDLAKKADELDLSQAQLVRLALKEYSNKK